MLTWFIIDWNWYHFIHAQFLQCVSLIACYFLLLKFIVKPNASFSNVLSAHSLIMCLTEGMLCLIFYENMKQSRTEVSKVCRSTNLKPFFRSIITSILSFFVGHVSMASGKFQLKPKHLRYQAYYGSYMKFVKYIMETVGCNFYWHISRNHIKVRYIFDVLERIISTTMKPNGHLLYIIYLLVVWTFSHVGCSAGYVLRWKWFCRGKLSTNSQMFTNVPWLVKIFHQISWLIWKDICENAYS